MFEVMFIVPLGTILSGLMSLLLKLSRKVKISASFRIVIFWRARGLMIGEDDIHFLRLHDIFIDDVVRGIVAIDIIILICFSLLIAKVNLVHPPLLYFLVVAKLALLGDAHIRGHT